MNLRISFHENLYSLSSISDLKAYTWVPMCNIQWPWPWGSVVLSLSRQIAQIPFNNSICAVRGACFLVRMVYLLAMSWQTTVWFESELCQCVSPVYLYTSLSRCLWFYSPVLVKSMNSPATRIKHRRDLFIRNEEVDRWDLFRLVPQHVTPCFQGFTLWMPQSLSLPLLIY